MFSCGYAAVLPAHAPYSPRVQARMRLQAGKSLLRLATVQEYQKIIVESANFMNVALVAQDPQFPVRQRFVGALLKLLVARQLPYRFNTIVFITAHDPDPTIPEMVGAPLAVISTGS
jgi:sister-chromatid-cohesion protein PDS5